MPDTATKFFYCPGHLMASQKLSADESNFWLFNVRKTTIINNVKVLELEISNFIA